MKIITHLNKKQMEDFINKIRKDPKVRIKINDTLDGYKKRTL